MSDRCASADALNDVSIREQQDLAAVLASLLRQKDPALLARGLGFQEIDSLLPVCLWDVPTDSLGIERRRSLSVGSRGCP